MYLMVLKAWEKLSPNLDHLPYVPLVLVNNFLFSPCLPATEKLLAHLSVHHTVQQPSCYSSTASPCGQLNNAHSMLFSQLSSVSLFSFFQLRTSLIWTYTCFLIFSPLLSFNFCPVVSENPSALTLPLVLTLFLASSILSCFCSSCE